MYDDGFRLTIRMCYSRSMSIVRIDASRIAQVEQLWQRSRFFYQNIGWEDLPNLLTNQIALLAEEQGRHWGFLCIQSEKRPSTLPEMAANRAYIRAVAVAQGRRPTQDLPQLIAVACTYLPAYAPTHALTVYGDQPWLNNALYYAGFTIVEEVQFLTLPHLQRWQPNAALMKRAQPPLLQLRPCHPDDLLALAYLDAESFTPVWHFDINGLRELAFAGRLQVACIDGVLVGYSATSYHDENAHLARLAVHPQQQGKGIGHALLLDALQAAKGEGARTVKLNTQVHNQRAQQLYRSFGFRPTRQIVPVLGKRIGFETNRRMESDRMEGML